MKIQLLTSLLLASATLAWAVPSEINYQGRLTDANGDAVTGDVTMSLKMFDAATGGNEIYSEDIGTVTLDSNGIYSFEFGAAGQSVIDRSDTIAVADGTATTFTGSVSSTPLSGTLSVSDGTYSWNIIDGNPGQQATATAQLVNGFVVGITVSNGGEGYTEAPVVTINGNGTAATATAVVENGVLTAINADTTGSGYTTATVSIAPPPAPYVVYYSAGTVTVTYESAPIARTEIVASYEANDSSIVGALSAADSHWLELSVNGSAQSPRERVLSVPFAQVAGKVSQITDSVIESVGLVKVNPVTETGYLSAYGQPIINTDITGPYGVTFNDQYSETLHVPLGKAVLFTHTKGNSAGYKYVSSGHGTQQDANVSNVILIKRPNSTPNETNSEELLFTIGVPSNPRFHEKYYGPVDIQVRHRVYSTATASTYSGESEKFARVGYSIVDTPSVKETGYLSAYGKSFIDTGIYPGDGMAPSVTWYDKYSDLLHVPAGHCAIITSIISSSEDYRPTQYSTQPILNDLLLKTYNSTPNVIPTADEKIYEERLLSQTTRQQTGFIYYGPADLQLRHRRTSSINQTYPPTYDGSPTWFATIGFVVVKADEQIY